MYALDDEVLVETIDNVSIYFQPMVEDTSPFDLFEDKEACETMDKIESGEWVWFVAKVTARIDGDEDDYYNLELASEYLCGCIYDSYEQFYTEYKDQCYSEMRDEVLKQSKQELKSLKTLLDKLVS